MSLSDTCVPSARVTSLRMTRGSVLFRRKTTCPSHINACAPLGWKEKTSSLGPQLLVLHWQANGPVVGPPIGIWLLLITGCRPFAGVEVGGPETPLPWSGSAQRFKARKPLGQVSTG